MILNLITFTSMPTMLMKRQHFSTKLEISKKKNDLYSPQVIIIGDSKFCWVSNTVLLFYLDTLQVTLCLAIVILFFMLYDCSIRKKKKRFILKENHHFNLLELYFKKFLNIFGSQK